MKAERCTQLTGSPNPSSAASARRLLLQLFTAFTCQSSTTGSDLLKMKDLGLVYPRAVLLARARIGQG